MRTLRLMEWVWRAFRGSQIMPLTQFRDGRFKDPREAVNQYYSRAAKVCGSKGWTKEIRPASEVVFTRAVSTLMYRSEDLTMRLKLFSVNQQNELVVNADNRDPDLLTSKLARLKLSDFMDLSEERVSAIIRPKFRVDQ